MKNPWLSGAIGVFLILGTAGYSLHLDRQSAMERSRFVLTRALDQMEVDLARSLASMEQMFLGFQHYLELTEQQPETDLAGLRRVMDTLVLNNPYLVSLVVTDGGGQVLHWTNSGPKPNLSERDYVRVHTAGGIEGMAIGAPLASIMSPGQWIFGTSKALRYPDGSINRILIAIIDTNRLFRRFEGLRPDPQAMLTLLSTSGIIYTRIPGHFEMVGQQRPELLTLAQSSAEGQDRSEIVTVDGKKQLVLLRQLTCCRMSLRGEIPVAGVLIPWQKNLMIFGLAAGLMVVMLVGLLRRLSDYRKREERLQQQLRLEAQRDPLTGLPLWPPANGVSVKDLDYPTAVLMIGLDQLTELSAGREEQAVAEVLTQSARILARFCSTAARLSRTASGNFLLLLPGVDRPQGLAIADQLRTALGAEVRIQGQTGTALTASVGVTLWDLCETELTAACKRAAEALATARAGGGNQCCWLAASEGWLERDLR